ncbi:hypothetical protein Pmani_018123 [Petrolisthes manimaculis]|uniref:Ionotropic glutamate receptor L-glutamate and glycine-binding domain-containing protein n=1 Tax=Petrolisthes manimaculis TaxID=1843537 RepID=A0AAE1PN25_9EUCA|nr:hypothetical protein Pmani_018123 [Petrolisthes manimaculis]
MRMLLVKGLGVAWIESWCSVWRVRRNGREAGGVLAKCKSVGWLRQVSRSLMVVVICNNPVFVAAFNEWSQMLGLHEWPIKLLILTHLKLEQTYALREMLSITNGMVFIMDNKFRCMVYIYLPFTPNDTQPLQVALWTSQRGIRYLVPLTLFPDKFSRFIVRPTLIVAEDEYRPHATVSLEMTSEGAREIFTGPMLTLLVILAHDMNFSYDLVRPPDGAWGAKMQNGSWSGMIGMLRRKEIDVGLGPFGVTSVRAEVVDYTVPLVVDYARILGGRGSQEVDPWGFLLPLKITVWVSILISLLVVLICWQLLKFIMHINTPSHRITWNIIFKEIFNLVRIMLQQDLLLKDMWNWERIVLGMWMLATLVISRSYGGNLMSLLAVRHIPQPYQSLRDVLDDPSVTMIWEANSAYVQYYRTAEFGLYRELAISETMGRIQYQRSSRFLNSVETLVRHGSHILIAEDLTHQGYVAEDFSKTG